MTSPAAEADTTGSCQKVTYPQPMEETWVKERETLEQFKTLAENEAYEYKEKFEALAHATRMLT
eukprot:10940650-Ditylum_brightwellii.AAC.1